MDLYLQRKGFWWEIYKPWKIVNNFIAFFKFIITKRIITIYHYTKTSFLLYFYSYGGGGGLCPQGPIQDFDLVNPLGPQSKPQTLCQKLALLLLYLRVLYTLRSMQVLDMSWPFISSQYRWRHNEPYEMYSFIILFCWENLLIW